MYRTLTAAVALAAGLGMAGLAQAQTNSTATPSSPMTTAPSASQPGMSGTQNPQPMSVPGSAPGQASTYGTSPQANMNQMNQGPQGAQQQASQSEIQQAQQQLKSQGLYRGAVDGIMGPETQTAVTAFQRQQGLPQSAQLDQQTLDRLNGSAPGTQNMTPSSATQNPAGSAGTTNGNSSLNGR
jgi:peptidoglycan hydrolase-like protein with peptidoglycan-binding domain